MGQASVSIIIPNRNSKTIDKTITSLFAQTAFDQIKEVLVVGVDEPDLVIEREPLRFISTTVPVTAPVARNIGIRQARGEYFVFIDSDCIADSEWLASLLAAEDTSHQIIGGSVSFDHKHYWQLCYNLTMFHEFLPTLLPGKRLNLGTLNLLVTRQVVEQVGLFDESLVRCQDTEWTLRMRQQGNTLYFRPQAVVKHLPEISGLSQILRLWHQTGFFSSIVRQKYRQLISPPPFYKIPLLLILLSPVIGALVTSRIFIQNPRLFRHIHTMPVVFLTKVAWCWGAGLQSLQVH